MRRRTVVSAGTLGVLVAAACWTGGCAELDRAAGGVADSAARPDAVTGQRTLNLLSPQDEAQKGLEFEQGLVADARAHGYAVDADAKARESCLSVMQRIVAVSASARSAGDAALHRESRVERVRDRRRLRVRQPRTLQRARRP